MDAHPMISATLDQAVLLWMQEMAPHGICITDSDLRVQGWNSWMETSSGIKSESAIGRELFELFPDMQSRRVEVYFKSALKGEISILSTALHKYLFPFVSKVPEAEVPNMLQTARVGPLVQDGEIVGTITTIEDVTQREYQNLLLRKQSERQELFSWALAYLLRSSDPELLVKQIFPRVAASMDVDTYFSYLCDESTGKMVLHSAIGAPPALKQQVAVCQGGEAPCEAASGERQMFVLSNIQASNDRAAVFARRIGLEAYVCHPLNVDGKILGTLSFGSRVRKSFSSDDIEFTAVLAQHVAIAIERSHNLKALNKAQAELSRHAESLEARVQERTTRLQESINELQSFSYSLAHDVRAPLRYINGYSELLLDTESAALTPTARGYIESIQRSIQKLDSLTRDMLAYTQVSRQPVNPESIDLAEVVRDIVVRNPGLAGAGVVEIGNLPRVLGERVLLNQVLSNLLDNALKFVKPGTQPKIVVRTCEDKSESNALPPGWTRICVDDNGIGISPDYHTKIFNMFETLTTDQKGTGIGLAIVAKAMKKMDGRFGVESAAGKGSRFWLELRKG
jgi:signal transduction histidine kinase